MHLRNQDQRSQTGGVHMSLSRSLRCQPTVSTPSSTVPSVPWRFLSLSLSTPVPILPGKPQCFRLQFQGYQSVQTSVKPHCSCTLPNLRCSTTHVLSHTCGNPILSWTKVTDKANSTLQVLMPQFLSLSLPSPGMTPGSVVPRTFYSVRPGSMDLCSASAIQPISTTTWPTCRDVTLSYNTFLVWTYAALLPSSPFPF